MKILLLLLLTLSAVQAKEAWPPKPFTHVVAYCYDYIRDPRGDSIIFKDGTHHVGIIAPYTRLLTEAQTKKLTTILNTSKYEGESDCYDPHHAFVFYDSDWKPVASIDICFDCLGFAARPSLFIEAPSFKALEALAKELGLPLFENLKDYQKLFNQHQLLNPQAPKPAPGETGGIDPFAEPESP